MYERMKMIFFIFLLFQIASCGQKGALYIPNDQVLPDGLNASDQMPQSSAEPPANQVDNNSSY